ncbi:MAG TPA: thiamine biosynthesis protein ThiS [Spirochaetia bacterium]|nr:MAG: thiamine biosynthesis protein ThiS [Spirochaetes bacterium GWB1_36_13]HCL57648.1 thiamine biosynthesis protein ThiS [Spirochaetia bacterium]
MKVTVNGKEQELQSEKISILKLMNQSQVKMPDMVIVQLNGEFVEKKDYEISFLKEGDELEFVYFMGGGGI